MAARLCGIRFFSPHLARQFSDGPSLSILGVLGSPRADPTNQRGIHPVPGLLSGPEVFNQKSCLWVSGDTPLVSPEIHICFHREISNFNFFTKFKFINLSVLPL